MRPKRNAASVLGLIGTHSADSAPVIDRCGSTCTRFAPRTRASASRQMPTTPPEASTLLPQLMMKFT